MSDFGMAHYMKPSYEMLDDVERLTAERDVALEQVARLTAALKEIAANQCGIPGHAVAVGCGSDATARAALASVAIPNPPTEKAQ